MLYTRLTNEGAILHRYFRTTRLSNPHTRGRYNGNAGSIESVHIGQVLYGIAEILGDGEKAAR